MSADKLIYRCPKFQTCSAPVCPLDPNWRDVPHLQGEATCFYLCERAKDGGAARLSMVLPRELAGSVSEAYVELTSSAGTEAVGRSMLRKTLRRASETGSRIESGKRLHAETKAGDPEAARNAVLDGNDYAYQRDEDDTKTRRSSPA